MFELYDNVLIKNENITGTIVDISVLNHETTFTVESDEEHPNKTSGYEKRFPLFYCRENEIELIRN